jgi:hypothetical protein
MKCTAAIVALGILIWRGRRLEAALCKMHRAEAELRSSFEMEDDRS